MAELLYGVSEADGKVISISEILALPDPNAMRGSKCGCICPHPGCNSPLLARLGKGVECGGNEPHFSHRPGFEGVCDIAYANESALHMLAKEIIAEERRFSVPNVEITWEVAGIKGVPEEVLDEIPVYKAVKGGAFDCTEVWLEKRVSEIIPDIIAATLKGQCLIEIFVTHRVAPEKKAVITDLRLPTIEINLSDFKDKEVTKDELREVLMTPNRRMRWIYYKGQEDALLKARDYYQNHPKVLEYFEQAKKSEIALQKWREEESQKLREQLEARKRADNNFLKLLQPENYAAALAKLRNDQAFWERARGFKFYIPDMGIPFFIDIPITGEMIFQCDRRIWQGIIFDTWVYNRIKRVSYIPVCPKDRDYKYLFDVLVERERVPVDKSLLYKFSVEAIGRKSFFLQRDVIFKYIEYLKALGFIGDIHYDWIKIIGAWTACTHSVDPPSKEYANKLQLALKQVDLCAPNVDDLISDALDPNRKQREEEERRARIKALDAKRKEEFEKYQEFLAQQAAVQEKPKNEKMLDQDSSEERLYCVSEEVRNSDFSVKDILEDQFGIRWIQCTVCYNILPDTEMSSYKYRQGTCRSCTRRYKNN